MCGSREELNNIYLHVLFAYPLGSPPPYCSYCVQRRCPATFLGVRKHDYNRTTAT